jgi:hypothetical protein
MFAMAPAPAEQPMPLPATKAARGFRLPAEQIAVTMTASAASAAHQIMHVFLLLHAAQIDCFTSNSRYIL